MTIIETLENAEHNINQGMKKQVWDDPTTKNCVTLGFKQLHNVTMLLIKGYSLYDDIDAIMGDKTVEEIEERL